MGKTVPGLQAAREKMGWSRLALASRIAKFVRINPEDFCRDPDSPPTTRAIERSISNWERGRNISSKYLRILVAVLKASQRSLQGELLEESDSRRIFMLIEDFESIEDVACSVQERDLHWIRHALETKTFGRRPTALLLDLLTEVDSQAGLIDLATPEWNQQIQEAAGWVAPSESLRDREFQCMLDLISGSEKSLPDFVTKAQEFSRGQILQQSFWDLRYYRDETTRIRELSDAAQNKRYKLGQALLAWKLAVQVRQPLSQIASQEDLGLSLESWKKLDSLTKSLAKEPWKGSN